MKSYFRSEKVNKSKGNFNPSIVLKWFNYFNLQLHLFFKNQLPNYIRNNF